MIYQCFYKLSATLDTRTMLLAVILIVGALAFFPALCQAPSWVIC